MTTELSGGPPAAGGPRTGGGPPTGRDPLTGKRVLVTGASGFIGSHVVRRLLAKGAQVAAMTRSVSAVTPVRLVDVADRIELVEADAADRSSLESLARSLSPEFVVHLAAFTHVGKSFERVEENIRTNIHGTVNLLQALAAGCERVVFVGTSEIYGDAPVPFAEDDPVRPVSPYAVSKYAAERYCLMFHHAYGWPITCLRPFNAYGPWQTPDRIIPETILTALRGGELAMTEGHQTREFNYVEDLAEGIVAALSASDIDGELVNLGCGTDISLRALATRILELMESSLTPAFGALPYRPTEIWRMYCDSSRARAWLGWQPRHSLDEGLAKTISWYRDELSRHPGRFLTPAGAS
jgi:nucleoside-diphosphate-sugar epimerase